MNPCQDWETPDVCRIWEEASWTESWVQRDSCDTQSSDVNLTQSPASARSLIMVTRLPHLGTRRRQAVGVHPTLHLLRPLRVSAQMRGSVGETEAQEPLLTATSALRRSWTGSMHCEQPASTTCRWLSQEPVMQM